MRAIIMLCLGLWAALLLNPGEVYAQRGLPGQVALGVNGGIADGFSFRDSHGAYRFWGELELTRYNRNHSYWNFAVSCLRKDYRYEGVLGDQLVPMAQFTAEAGYNHFSPGTQDRFSPWLFGSRSSRLRSPGARISVLSGRNRPTPGRPSRCLPLPDPGLDSGN